MDMPRLTAVKAAAAPQFPPGQCGSGVGGRGDAGRGLSRVCCFSEGTAETQTCVCLGSKPSGRDCVAQPQYQACNTAG